MLNVVVSNDIKYEREYHYENKQNATKITVMQHQTYQAKVHSITLSTVVAVDISVCQYTLATILPGIYNLCFMYYQPCVNRL